MSSTLLFRKEITNINQEHFGQLIGKFESRLNEIKIEFEPDSGLDIIPNFKKSLIVIIANDSKTVEKCEKIFQLLIEEIETRGQLNRYSVPRSFRKLEELSKFSDLKKPTYNESTKLYSYSLRIPEKYIGRMIGKGGATVKSILSQYKYVRIKFDTDDKNDQGDTLVVITSKSSDECQSALICFKEVFSEKKQGMFRERLD